MTNLETLKIDTLRLLDLLRDPHPGLSSWNRALASLLKTIAEFAPKEEDMSEDPVRYTETAAGLELALEAREAVIRERLLRRVEELVKLNEGDAPLVAAARLFSAYSVSRAQFRLDEIEGRLIQIAARVNDVDTTLEQIQIGGIG